MYEYMHRYCSLQTIFGVVGDFQKQFVKLWVAIWKPEQASWRRVHDFILELVSV